MGVLKIWHMNPDVVESQGMLQHVQTLLSQDNDPQVLGNCVTLLMQVQGVKRLSSNKLLVYTLINRIKVSRGGWVIFPQDGCDSSFLLPGWCDLAAEAAAAVLPVRCWQRTLVHGVVACLLLHRDWSCSCVGGGEGFHMDISNTPQAT